MSIDIVDFILGQEHGKVPALVSYLCAFEYGITDFEKALEAFMIDPEKFMARNSIANYDKKNPIISIKCP